ncbi:MAG: glucose 1-dehydrogenase [Acidimicrobiia bacterium]|nr:glucose 1-dehydrogenase [Acidimicrobiia bacterium]
MSKLDGRVAVITGGASGIGAATAKLFIDEGARVLIADMQRDVGEEYAASLGENADFRQTDVTEEDQVAAAIAQAHDRWGTLDVVFNNAGFGGAMGPIEAISEAEWDLTFDVLLKGVFFGIKHAAPIMKAQNSGSIINTASVAGIQTGMGAHLYSVAKSAVITLTKTTANELAENMVRVNAICPGIIPTPLSSGKAIGDIGRDAAEQRVSKMTERLPKAQPMPKAGDPMFIARTALFLASDDSEWVTGTAHVVDGGWLTGKPWRSHDSWVTQTHPIKLYRPEGR